jgi:hypothetical protein
METRNIEDFKREHPGIKFPDYRHLTANETEAIRRRLKILASLPENIDNLTLTRHIAKISKICDCENANDEKFNLSATLNSLDIFPEDQVYINFYRFDEVDKMLLNDVSRWFRFIWYPVSDDIEIFDDSLEWILSVTHDGEIQIVRLPKQPGNQ